jgi:hypothetical protein
MWEVKSLLKWTMYVQVVREDYPQLQTLAKGLAFTKEEEFYNEYFCATV